MPCLEVCRLRAHEMGEFEGYGLVITTASGGLQFQPQLVELDREEMDRHVAVEAFCIGPALHAVLVCQLLIYGEEGIQLVIIYVSILESTSIDMLALW